MGAEQTDGKVKVLAICQGNVGRSQMFEGFYNAYSQEGEAASAGIDDVAAKYGGHPTPLIIEVMMEKGIDVSAQEIKQVTEEMVQQAEMIVILCEPEICPPFVIGAMNVVLAEVTDPYLATGDKTRLIRDEIEQIVKDLLAKK
jgi:arsenate reductase (thioredoxin)